MTSKSRSILSLVAAASLIAAFSHSPVRAARPWHWYYHEATPESPTQPYTRVVAGQQLLPTQSWGSPNGKYKLRFQKDGRFGLYQMNGTSTPPRIWVSNGGTTTQAGRAVMEASGALTCYDALNSPLWAAGGQRAGAFLAVQDDGNVGIYVTTNAGTFRLWDRVNGANYDTIPG